MMERLPFFLPTVHPLEASSLSTTSKNQDGKQIAHWGGANRFSHVAGKIIHGNEDFARRSKILDALEDGTLITVVRMRQIEAKDTPVPPFIPANPLCKNILKWYGDEKSADIVFEVGSECEGGRGARKRVKTAPTIFYAHRLILRYCAPTLGELCKSANKMSPIRITDVKPDIFHHMLYYIYGGELDEGDMMLYAKDIIDACDKYGVVHLKLEAEACYARSITLTVDNVLDNLLYADSKNCALLKVMDYIVENGSNILGTVSFENVPGSMMTDLLTAVTRGKRKDDAGSGDNDYDTMRVGALRKKLHEKGLDIDGSREAMIALLKVYP
ncbi:hypothetical protein ACHAXR_013386 [Thalassiosira sp. AJA248-18]